MSEYQFVAFRAVDRPLTDRELAFAEEQSSRAAITPWSFENEYHYGEFRGDVEGLLRHGYDAHLHYANYGIRKIALRLPAGWPIRKPVWSKFVADGAITWTKDARGQGVILMVDPSLDSRDEIWDPGDYLEGVVEIRNRLLAGDVRGLYVLWLCAVFSDAYDFEDMIEPPVPGGLAECVESCEPLLEFFGLDPLILIAASEGAPEAPARPEPEQPCVAWIAGLSEAESKRLLRQLLLEDTPAVKAAALAKARKSGPQSSWPTVVLKRSLLELLERTETLRAEEDVKDQKKRQAQARRKAAKQERERQARHQEMVKNPQVWLRETEQLVQNRGTKNYKTAAEILADLRDAIGGEEGEKFTRKHAAHLVKKHPTLGQLKSSLRKRGLLE